MVDTLLFALQGWLKILFILFLLGLLVGGAADTVRGKFVFSKRVLKIGGVILVVTLVLIFVVNFAKAFFGV